MELLSLERSCGLYIRHTPICYVIFSLILLLSRLYTDTFVLYLLIYGSLFILYINLIIINNIFAVKIKFRDSREREREKGKEILTARSLICFLLISFTENMNHVIYVFVTYFCYISIIKVSF
jgi:hypothetical protein